jgi:hypothetical protein
MSVALLRLFFLINPQKLCLENDYWPATDRNCNDSSDFYELYPYFKERNGNKK